MFEFITDTEERGQVGIGTLIVFIAMVLVAAIAAGVLINTAGFLQTQAEATGQDSTDLVSERIDVSSSVGIVDSAADGTLNQVRLTVSGAPGADDIDLGDTTIQAVGPGGQQNLVFASGAEADNSVSVPDGQNNTDVPVEVNEFTTEIDVGVSELDDTYTLNISHNGAFDTKDIDPTNNEDDQIVTVELDDVDPSTNLSQNVSINLEDGETVVKNDTGESQSGSAEIESSADSELTEQPSELSGDEIIVPAEIDEDADSVTIGVSNTTAANLTISADGTTLTNNSLPDENRIEASLNATDAGEIDPATVDELEIELVDQDNADNVLDSGTVTTVDSVQSVDDLRADEFAVEEDGEFKTSAVLGNQDQYTVVLNPEKGALRNGDNFGEGDTATLDLVSPAGATTQVELRAPDLFNEDGQAVRL